jgi:hypothetical protein
VDTPTIAGHWLFKFFGHESVIKIDQQKYKRMREYFFGLIANVQNAYSENFVKTNFVKVGLGYASTLYAARFLPWTTLTLRKVIDEIEPYLDEVELSPSDKDVLMAVYEYLTIFNRVIWGSGQDHSGKAYKLGLQVFRDYDGGKVPLSIFLLVNARMSRLPQVGRSNQFHYSNYVKVEVKKLTNLMFDLESHQVDQIEGSKILPKLEFDQIDCWKTVSRLGALIKDWPMVEMALLHDNSRTIHIKSWMLPGYVLYKIKKKLLGKR